MSWWLLGLRLRALVLALLHGFDEGRGRGDAGVDF